MRNWPVRLLLAGCGGVLLSLQGCGSPQSVTLAGLEGEEPARASKATKAEAPFRLPGDTAGKMLGSVLPPAARPGALPDPTPQTPKELPPPRWRQPAVLLPSAGTDLARLPAQTRPD